MDELIRVSRAILEDFDLYGQPIPLRLLAELRRAVEAAHKACTRQVESSAPQSDSTPEDLPTPKVLSQPATCG